MNRLSFKKKIPAYQKRKITEDQLNNALKQTVIKSLSKAVKTCKTFLVLKQTKKVNKLKTEGNENTNEIELLDTYKNLDHLKIAQYFGQKKYSTILGSTNEEIPNLPNDKVLNAISSSKIFNESIEKIENDIKKLKTRPIKKDKSQLQPNSKSHSSTKITKSMVSKAIFVESLAGDEEIELGSDDDEEDSQEDSKGSKKNSTNVDQKEMVKIQKSLRNRINRASKHDLKHKELEKLKGLSMYMSLEERDNLNKLIETSSKKRVNSDQLNGSNNNKRSKYDNNHSSRNPSKDLHSNSHSHTSKFVNTQVNKDNYFDVKKAKREIEINKDVLVPAIPSTSELTQLAAEGKDWKESGVHPSWAAKQMNKPIVVGQGKKITFDE